MFLTANKFDSSPRAELIYFKQFIMKQFKTVVIASALLLLASCNKDDRAIRKTAQGYLDAMGNYQIEAAEPFATEETRTKTLHFVEKIIMPITDTNYINSNRPATITLGDITYTSDTTATIAFHKKTPIKEEDGTLDLVKRNDTWQAQVLINVPQLLLPMKTHTSDSIDGKRIHVTRTDSIPDLTKGINIQR